MQPKPTRRPPTWHQRAGKPVRVWFGLIILAGIFHRYLPDSRWLLVHLFTLGAVTNSVVVWSQHFTEGFLGSPLPESRRRTQLIRIYVLNLGIVAAIVGVLADWWHVTVSGSVIIGAAVAWHGVGLLQQISAAKGGWNRAGVWFYVGSAFLLPVGAGFGAALAYGFTDTTQAGFLLAHQAMNLLGFLGLAAAGTLLIVYPRLLRAEVPGRGRALPALGILLAGIAAATAGALLDSPNTAAAGVGAYLAGWLLVALPMMRLALRDLPQHLPRGYAAMSVTAALLWLLGSLTALTTVLATGPLLPERLAPLTVPFIVGFAAQLLLGIMTQLLPNLMGGQAAVIAVGVREMDRWATWRIVVINGGLLMWLLPLPSWTRVGVSALVMVAFVAFLPIMIRSARATLAARRAAVAPKPTGPASMSTPIPTPMMAAPADPAPARRSPALQATAALACLALVAALGTAISAPAPLDAANGAVATGETTQVDVVAKDMRFMPAEIEVPVGNRLVINVTNADDQVHDLVLETGQSTGRLGPGQSRQLDAGVIGRDVDGWCSIVGHRQQGMVFQVRAEGQDPANSAAAPGPHHSATGADSINSHAVTTALNSAPAPEFQARDAALAPAPGGTTHQYTFDITEVPGEFAPGLEQVLWTYNGAAGGPTLRGELGDVFEVTLVNNGTMGHSIDFHAGMVNPDTNMRTINPGESLVYTFRAEHTGIWLYHCSTKPMSVHIAAGMFGAVIIDPPGLAPVDAEYLLQQSEAYLGPQRGEIDADKVAAKTPDLVMFNGYANQYLYRPLTAKVGDRIRIWLLDVGPNLTTSFHVVGAQFDTVYKEGAYLLRPDNALHGASQALDLTPAQGGFVELEFTEPGSYSFVSHIMSDAEKGAAGKIVVTE
ncbi:multicopper oxidase domain-containing protein [Tomitella biformata]|uniref:multicopper oxidase domain-containing protein n=1 Tax=Tomitella biformata TaxID=630403 RepID=UPI0004638B73|nr:multicopper oxidase domain-containing protein [Tomitella biformata]